MKWTRHASNEQIDGNAAIDQHVARQVRSKITLRQIIMPQQIHLLHELIMPSQIIMLPCCTGPKCYIRWSCRYRRWFRKRSHIIWSDCYENISQETIFRIKWLCRNRSQIRIGSTCRDRCACRNRSKFRVRCTSSIRSRCARPIYFVISHFHLGYTSGCGQCAVCVLRRAAFLSSD